MTDELTEPPMTGPAGTRTTLGCPEKGDEAKTACSKLRMRKINSKGKNN